MIEAILWDNDGVLVDTEGLFFDATRDALARAGVSVTRNEFIDHVLRTGSNLFDRLLERGWSPDEITALREERNDLYSERLRRESLLIAGAADVVRKLAARYRMAIVTSSLRVHLEIGHRHGRILSLFETVVTREDYERSKPDPEPYLTALARLKLAARACVAIEDSERGLLAARAAGLRCVIVPNGLTLGGRFEGAEAVLESVAQVPAAIERLSGGRP
jgi:HAD superfamily hydrolase (TIGR01509 family)